ncbi:M56 family metallopeptidase [Daejeonella sp.]|uniref:M56 family metallopeptidase n=1 Tax=Daejeonella sp. TaxID=2805397 RepID=UPI003983AE92
MELTILFSALSQAIFYSILIGLIVYAFVKLIITAFSELPSSDRYKILYTGMIWIFVSFIVSFSDAFLTELNNAKINVPLQTFEQRALSVEAFKSESLLPGISKWIAIIYFAGLLTQSAMLLFSLFQVNRIREKSFRKVDLRLNSQLNLLSKKLNLKKKVTLSIANDTLIPCTIGFIKPIILFPIAIINSLNPAEVEAILLHELAHIKRNDYLFNIIQRIMEMVLFFNPAIWFIGKEIRNEREYCCDDLVIQNTSNPMIYAKALLQIAENKTHDLNLSLFASGTGKYTLFNRIKRITNMNAMNLNPKPHLLVSLTVVAVCISLAWMIPAEQVVRQQKNNHTAASKIKPDTVRLEIPTVPNPAEAPPIHPIHPMQSMQSIHTKPELMLAPLAPNVPELPEVPLMSSPVIPHTPSPIAISFASDTNKLKKKLSSSEWKKHMEEMKIHTEEIKRHFESPEWKKQIADMKVNAEQMKLQAFAMQKEFNSPEWKIKIEEMKKLSIEMKKQFESPEWKKKIDEMKINSEEMRKQFDSPEWKKNIEEMRVNAEEFRKQFDSPEWIKQIEEIKMKSQEIKQEAERVKKTKVTP